MKSSDPEKPIKINTYSVSKRSQLRGKIRQQRRSFSPEQQNQASSRLLKHILKEDYFKKAGTLAFYQAFDGEIDPAPAVKKALELGKRCFLPVLNPSDTSLAFVEYTLGTSLKKNHFGILEPIEYPNNALASEHMDVIFMPLVAFDMKGNRLGMGKGYYDKSLAFMLKNVAKVRSSSKNTPTLIGLAHECQRVDGLERAEWDVPLDKIITDQTTYTTIS